MVAVEHAKPCFTEVDPTEWVDLYGDMLMSYAMARLRRQDLAEDMVQETFLAAWKRRNEFEERSKFSTWLIAILRNKIADHFRASGREAQISEESEMIPKDLFTKSGKWSRLLTPWNAAPDQIALNREFWSVFASCLAQMPAHLSHVYRLRELKSAAVQEISEQVEISVANVSVRLHRARLSLRQCLEEKWFQE
ncbi:sigma-70 family RNA polymerase sigma factor [Bythopirellula polymerisocia]|uniref:ECF RNA polymerase sigma factor SigW n=1 Tax=Bythopirellula polymerisocia TaxID=2528003 RepID=A0A5C6CJM8_9BACT|nr:sigma-70 family RNA polymerase sigma factor [Bythopirellula polymerisocia]TWU23787.1 ECF RNA polymerase sigma factor SigW [Bythopirellula polymerisocia]